MQFLIYVQLSPMSRNLYWMVDLFEFWVKQSSQIEFLLLLLLLLLPP